jgi:hypothetical protein
MLILVVMSVEIMDMGFPFRARTPLVIDNVGRMQTLHAESSSGKNGDMGICCSDS